MRKWPVPPAETAGKERIQHVLHIIYIKLMDLTKQFTDGPWSHEINVTDFVRRNITPYEGDASFLQGPTARTLAVF